MDFAAGGMIAVLRRLTVIRACAPAIVETLTAAGSGNGSAEQSQSG